MNWITTGPYSKHIRIYNDIEGGGGNSTENHISKVNESNVTPEAVEATQRNATNLADIHGQNAKAEQGEIEVALDKSLSQLTPADMSNPSAIGNVLEKTMEKAGKEMDNPEYKAALANWEEAMKNDPVTLGKITTLLGNGTNAPSGAPLQELMNDSKVRERLIELSNLSIIPLEKAMQKGEVDPTLGPAIIDLKTQLASVHNK